MLVLASASPRRQELLRNAGISFTVQPAEVDETPLPAEGARECAERLAHAKALRIWRTRPQETVLGADTVVVVNAMMLAKPADAAAAAQMLRALAGRTHQVITGVSLIRPALSTHCPEARDSDNDSAPREVQTASEATLVTMIEISDQEIADYVASGEPMDKAGGYAIQGRASRWIPRIEGDYTNVVGLPVALVYRMLQESGWPND